MGILDAFQGLGNLTPEQSQGLLAFASQALQQSGPSRTPTSFGQILGGGLNAYQHSVTAAQKAKQEQEQADQIKQLTGLKIKDATSDLQNQELARQRASDLQKFYIARGLQGQGAPGGAAPAISTPQAMGSNLAPTTDNAALMSQLQPQQAATPDGGGGAQTMGIFQQRMALASTLRNAGFSQEADAQEASALKFQPKVKGWEKVTQGGKVLLAPYFEDGTSGAPVPLEVAEKLQFQNTGGKTLGLNPFTGQSVASYNNTLSPDTAATVGATIRGQDLVNQRGIESNQIARERLSADKAPTEFQGKSAAYGLRAKESDKILNALAAAGGSGPLGVVANDRPGMVKSIAESVPLVGGGLGAAVNTLPSWAGGPNANQQKAEQAQRDFVNAVLRQESGAAIGAGEFDNAKRQYFPQAGDTPEVISQKARNRQLAIQGLEANAGKNKLTAPGAAGGWSIQKVED